MRNKETEGERRERSRGEDRRGVAAPVGVCCRAVFVCVYVCAGGQTDDERRKRHEPQMKGWEAERRESRSVEERSPADDPLVALRGIKG